MVITLQPGPFRNDTTANFFQIVEVKRVPTENLTGSAFAALFYQRQIKGKS